MTGSLSCWSTCRRRSTCSSPRARIRPCRWHGCEGAGSCWRSAPPICASRRRRPRSTSTTRWGWNWGHRTSGLWRVAPKGGLPHCSSRRSPCGAADDAAGFIAGFAGDDRYVVHYLAEEVLQRQTEEVRNFSLRTSVLGRLNGSQCEAVTGQDGGNAMLHALDRENLFLIPLDDGRRWYRYHHLFADVLQRHLRDEQPESLSDLHGRGSDWYERNGQRSEAIDHALAAGDHERVADLAKLALPALARGRQEATLRRWMEALPVELFATRPVLSVGYAGALMSTGRWRTSR